MCSKKEEFDDVLFDKNRMVDYFHYTEQQTDSNVIQLLLGTF